MKIPVQITLKKISNLYPYFFWITLKRIYPPSWVRLRQINSYHILHAFTLDLCKTGLFKSHLSEYIRMNSFGRFDSIHYGLHERSDYYECITVATQSYKSHKKRKHLVQQKVSYWVQVWHQHFLQIYLF